MKPIQTLFALPVLALTILASVNAQDGGPGRGPQDGGQRRPPSPLIAALDLNKDGEISADELAKAAESLKALDTNGDGKLSREELRPPRPQGGDQEAGQQRGGGRGQGGPDQQGGQRPGRRGQHDGPPQGAPGNGGPRGQ